MTATNRALRSRGGAAAYLLAGALLLVACALPLTDGGGSRGGNPVVTGRIVNPDGTGASRTLVQIFPQSYDPVKDNALPAGATDTTDESGSYTVRTVGPGMFNVQAVHLIHRTRLLVREINIEGDTAAIGADTLRRPGVILVPIINGFDTVSGYVYVPGTSIAVSLRGMSDYVILDSVPSGTALAVDYAIRNSSSAPSVIRDSVYVPQNDTVKLSFLEWKYLQKLFINTSPSGANVSGDVHGFPVLVRLTAARFDFAEAEKNGEDIRFTKTDGSQIPYEIERWDPVAGFAEVWVKVDTVYGNNDGQYIVMYWGASAGSATSSMSNGAAVFDTGNGFQGVWHMGEAGNAIAKDATANHFDGTPSDTAPEGAAGVIGSCRSFNGTSNFIRMNGTADSRLNFQENGTYTVSAWVYADTIDNRSHLVVGKSNEQYFMKFKFSIPTDPMVWEFVEYHDKTGWSITNSLPVAPSAKTWTHIVGVREGTSQFFYLNGELVDSSISVSPATAPRQTGEDVTIGRFLSVAPDSLEGKCPFLGKIDEVRISNAAYGADWIKLCYMNQKELDALVKW
jgi:hypothetical protein